MVVERITIMTDAPQNIDNPNPNIDLPKELERVEAPTHAEVVNTLGQAMEVFDHTVAICKKEPLAIFDMLPEIMQVRQLMIDLVETNRIEDGLYTGENLTNHVLKRAALIPGKAVSLSADVDEPSKAYILRRAFLDELRKGTGEFLTSRGALPPVAEKPRYPVASSADKVDELLLIEEVYANLAHDVGTALTATTGANYYANPRDPAKKDLDHAIALIRPTIDSMGETLDGAVAEFKEEHPEQELTLSHLFGRLNKGFWATLKMNNINLKLPDLTRDDMTKSVKWFMPAWGRLIANEEQNFIREHGKITKVEVSYEILEIDGTSYVEIKFRDDGGGYPGKILDDQFENPITIREDNSGTGRGMRAQQEGIKKYGGLLIARNPEGGGAELTVRLPLYESSESSQS